MNNLFFVFDENEIATPNGTILVLSSGVMTKEEHIKSIMDWVRKIYDETYYDECDRDDFDKDKVYIWPVTEDYSDRFFVI